MFIFKSDNVPCVGQKEVEAFADGMSALQTEQLLLAHCCHLLWDVCVASVHNRYFESLVSHADNNGTVCVAAFFVGSLPIEVDWLIVVSSGALSFYAG